MLETLISAVAAAVLAILPVSGDRVIVDAPPPACHEVVVASPSPSACRQTVDAAPPARPRQDVAHAALSTARQVMATAYHHEGILFLRTHFPYH